MGGSPVALRASARSPEPLLLEPLERVGRGARLERAAARDLGTPGLDALGHRPELLPRLDGARPGHHGEAPAADRGSVDADDGIGRVHLAGSRA